MVAALLSPPPSSSSYIIARIFPEELQSLLCGSNPGTFHRGHFQWQLPLWVKACPAEQPAFPKEHPSVSMQYSSYGDPAQSSLNTLDCHFSAAVGRGRTGGARAQHSKPILSRSPWTLENWSHTPAGSALHTWVWHFRGEPTAGYPELPSVCKQLIACRTKRPRSSTLLLSIVNIFIDSLASSRWCSGCRSTVASHRSCLTPCFCPVSSRQAGSWLLVLPRPPEHEACTPCTSRRLPRTALKGKHARKKQGRHTNICIHTSVFVQMARN